MKKLILLLTLTLVVALNAEVIEVGAVLPLTGEYESSGAAMREGMRLGLEEYGPTKHTYKLIFEDSEFSPSRASLAAQKLANVDKVDFLTSMWGPTAMAVCPISDAKRVVHLANDWDQSWTLKHPYTLNLATPGNEYARITVEMLKRWGMRRIAFIHENSADWNSTVTFFEEAVKREVSMEIVSDKAFNQPVRDFRMILAEMNDTKPDVLLIWSILPESEIILRQAKQIGMSCRMTGYFEDLDEKALAEGYSFICANTLGDDFIRRFEKRFHRKPISATAVGYDQMNAIIRACEKFDGKAEATTIVDAMKNLPPWQGASGEVRPRNDKFLLVPMKIVKYKNGVMVPDPDFANLNKEMGWQN